MVKKNDEEFADREIFSGDIIRFGVDVVEHDTTHGCIIAQVALYHPSGAEAKQNVDPVSNNNAMTGIDTLHTEQMFRFAHYISEALFREQVLDTKLESIKRLLHEAQEISEAGWQSMVDEDQLLEKLSLYESQLSLLKQNLPENSLQSHLMQALEEKFNLEKASKIMLERLLNEKAEVFSKATDLEHSLVVSQQECIRLRQDYEKIHEAYQNLANDRQLKHVASEGSKENKVEKSDMKVDNEQLNDEKAFEKIFDQFLYSDHKTNNKQALDSHNGGNDANILLNGLDNGISKIPEYYDDKLNNIDERFNIQNIDMLKSSEPNNSSETQGQHVITNDESHNGHTSVQITESIRLFNQSNQLIKLLQDELNTLNKMKKSNESTTLCLPVNSDSNEIDTFDSLDAVDSDKNSLKKLYTVNCKEKNFETALQHATEYAALIANIQNQLGTDLNSLCLLRNHHHHHHHDNADIFNSHNDVCIPPDEFRTNHVTKVDVSLGTETLADHIQSTEMGIDETTSQKVEINHLEASVTHKDSHADDELLKLHSELTKSVNEIETYKQLTEDLRKQDAAKAELLLLVRGECDTLKNRIAVIETDVATSRADHHRLVSEARRAQTEANELLLERDNLSKQLNSANNQIEHLQKLLATTLLGDKVTSSNSNKNTISNEISSMNSSLTDNLCSTNQRPNRTSNLPLHEHCFSLFAVIPVMLVICAFMVYIFLKFVR
ncbi:unnamed protein product [Schistosoma turkestanicum]|nr:unnamed protein product [Schistosoma turkestanicum]